MQLCCARNKRRMSAKRYFGAARIVSKHARKGFAIKLNVDSHWSCSFYKGLDYLQNRGGLNMMVLNRDQCSPQTAALVACCRSVMSECCSALLFDQL